MVQRGCACVTSSYAGSTVQVCARAKLSIQLLCSGGESLVTVKSYCLITDCYHLLNDCYSLTAAAVTTAYYCVWCTRTHTQAHGALPKRSLLMHQ